MKNPGHRLICVFIAAALILPLFMGTAFAAAAPLINGKEDLGWFSATISSNMQKPYEIPIVVTGAPEPTVTVTGTAGAYYKNGKIIVPTGLKASTTPYTINIVAQNEAGRATMGVRINVAEVVTINGYYRKSVTINLKEGYSGPYAISCVVSGLPAPTTNIETDLNGVIHDSGKLYIPAGLTAEHSPYTVKVSATNVIAEQSYTAETTYTINVYADGFDETGDIEAPLIEGPDSIELVEGYESRPALNYTITGKPYPVITATGLDGVDYIEGVLYLPLGLSAETRDYLVTLTASNDYGSDVKRIAVRVIIDSENGNGGNGNHTPGDGDPTPGPDPDPDPDPDPTPEPTKKPSSGGSSSSTTITVNDISISAKAKDDTLTMKPSKSNIEKMFGDFEDTEYVFDLSAQDYKEVVWKLNPKWFSKIDEGASITFLQPAGYVTITGSMMLKLIDKAPSGVIDFVFRGNLIFVIEKGSNRAKWSDTEEPIYIQIPFSGESTDGLRIKTEQSGTSMPDAENVEYVDGFVCGTVYNTGKYTVE